MIRFLSKVFGKASRPESTLGVSPIEPRLRAADAAAELRARIATVNIGTRPPEFWTDNAAKTVVRLREEWGGEREVSKYPDVEQFLALLEKEPDDLIGQLPAAAQNALRLCDDPSLSRVRLADELSLSPALVQGLLRQANSSWYGAGLTPIIKMDEAIERVGVTGTRAVVLAYCVEGLLSKPGGHFDTMVSSVWNHMVSTGPLGRPVAEIFGANREEAFAVALLHDIGKLVMFDRVSALRQRLRRDVQFPDRWISRALQQLHEPLGAIAAHRWGLGPTAADAIGTHHRRDRTIDAHPLAETLFLAEYADHARRRGAKVDFEWAWEAGRLNGDIQEARLALSRLVRASA